MIGSGSDENNRPEDQPSTPPPPSAPLHPTGGFGRRLLCSIRALLPAPTPAAAHKVSLGLLLHLRPDHPCIRPTPSASQEEGKDAAAGRNDGSCSDAAASELLSDGAAVPSAPPHLPKPPAKDTVGNDGQFCAIGEPGASKAEKVLEQQGAVNREGIAAAQDEDKLGSHLNVDANTHDTAVNDQDKAVVSATANGTSDMRIGKKGKVKRPYPQRPRKLNCPSYMTKGSCSYGFSCQLRHPPRKAKPDGSSEQGNHGVAAIPELNRVGLPIQEGAKNCTYYMRNGACGYGKRCQFNHPERVMDAQFNAPTVLCEDSALQLEKSSDHHTQRSRLTKKKPSGDATLDDGTSYSKKSSDHAILDDISSSTTGVLPPNIFRMLLPPQKVLPGTEAMVIPVKKDSNWSSTSDDSDGCCSAVSSDGPLCKQEHVDSSTRPFCKQEHVDYPERPGRPECPFYMRFGDCKFASACNYHHPKDRYPEIPGEPECLFYMKHGFCKFGAQCRFNHPKDSNPTAQSPTNAKKYFAANEHYRPTRITLGDHMPKQQQYPERPGQLDCRYYLQFGKCKFLSACIFHHPRDGLPSGPAHSDQVGPETHGMPECPLYVKGGRCQFGSACEFRHPKDTTEGTSGHKAGLAYDNSARPENAAQQRGETLYPERPGEPECVHYMRHGSCRFQMNCKFHHPAVRLSREQYSSTYH